MFNSTLCYSEFVSFHKFINRQFKERKDVAQLQKKKWLTNPFMNYELYLNYNLHL